MSTWLIPVLVVGVCLALSVPVGYYLAWIVEGRYRSRAPWLAPLESLFDTGPQNWKQYGLALLAFNTLLFVFGFVALALQPYLPWDAGRPELAPTTIFNTTISFLTNTNLQHYTGEIHLSYSSQILFVVFNMFVSAAVGFCALAAIIRGLRGDEHLGNFYLDLWRVVAYVFFPASLLVGFYLIPCGVPMTFEPTAEAVPLEANSMGTNADGTAKTQNISRGPVAAVLPIKHLGTNGGGFFGANSAHPFENPSFATNLVEIGNFLIFPFSLVILFGVMLKRMRDAAVIYGVMMTLFVGMIVWVEVFDAARPNDCLLARDGKALEDYGMKGPALAALPVDSGGLGNLEGKELRFGPGASSFFVAGTTAITCGSVDCAHDSLNSLAGLTPLSGMWLNCVFGGKGVGLINLLVYLFIAVFFAGLMVGRTPEYLGKKVEAREMKLAMLAMLAHPILVLGPTGLFAAIDWGTKAINNPGAHGFSEILYEFSSSSANNGSGFEGLGDTWGFNKEVPDNPQSKQAWDIGTGLVMLFGRFLPIIAPLALAGGLAVKKRVPFTVGTLRTDTLTFACILLGTILLVGALLFMPAAMLGPVAERFGPIPFGS